MHDTEVLNRSGHGHVEEAEPSSVGAGDGGGLDHDDGVELEALGRWGRHDGYRPGHGVTLEHADLGVSSRQPGHLGHEIFGYDDGDQGVVAGQRSRLLQ